MLLPRAAVDLGRALPAAGTVPPAKGLGRRALRAADGKKIKEKIVSYPSVQLHIDGKWRPAATGRTLVVINPGETFAAEL